MTRLRLVALGVCVAALAAAGVVGGVRYSPSTAKAPTAKAGTIDHELAPRLAQKLATSQRYSPGVIGESEDGGGWAVEDWLMHSQDGAENSTPPASAFATAQNDWAGLMGRPVVGAGKWTPLGPTNAMNDLNNPFRNRTVYTTGTENFGGRTPHAVISPDCAPAPAACTLWIAASNAGVWRTDNALAADDPGTAAYEGPSWQFVSPGFAQQNVSSLELDPNDHNTLWAGTGEPNACGSGCEVGVGIYKSTGGGTIWTGPYGAKEFFGRGVGSIQVKPGDSNTIFVATARATRGISNTCCNGTDALIPGAAHFGIWRSTNAGKSWQLVNQGASALCTASTTDAVSLNQTPCSPRGARRVMVDPVDRNTVYASFFARGIWRSKQNGDPGTWEQIMAPLGNVGPVTPTTPPPLPPTTERAEFDLVPLPSGETRMYVGVGAGNYTEASLALASKLRVNNAVRNAPAATMQSSWVDKATYSFSYCAPQCSYDNYVYAPANPENAPNSGATVDTVYLSGSNGYNENNTGTGRSNGRAVLLSTDGGDTFTDMTEDDRDQFYPGALHPDHHALVVNPNDWKQFFDFSDGGVNRSNGVFVNDTGDCTAPPHSFTVASRIAFCQVVLARVPQRLTAINRGLRTLHMYTLDYDRNNPDRLAAGTQDNGSWETLGSTADWLQVYIADGGPSRFDATGTDSQFAVVSSQGGALSVRYDPMKQTDVNWIADTLADAANSPYALEGSAFIVPMVTDPVQAGWMWTGREHVFRSTNWGRNPVLATKAAHRANCNVWNGAFGDLNGDNAYNFPADACDDWRPLGDPGAAGRLTNASYGADRTGAHVSVTQRAPSDTSTLWAATASGRVFVSKNADAADPATVVFDRIDNDPTAANTPPRFPSDIYVDPQNANHAWITYSGYNSKTPTTPGHVFEVFYAPNASTFVNLDGNQSSGYGDIPANAIIVTKKGTIYVGNDYGVVVKQQGASVWKAASPGLPNMDVAELLYLPQRDVLIAGTHGQGAWQLKVQ